MKKANCLILLILVLITSCRKEEDLMEERYVGEINLNQEYGLRVGSSSLNSDYSEQAFFDLGTGVNVSSNQKFIWDVAISNTDGFVQLNSAKSNLRATVLDVEWGENVDPQILDELLWDPPHGIASELAVGSIEDQLFILDRGLNESGEAIGYKKAKLQINSDNSVELTVASLDGTDETVYDWVPDLDYTFTYVHFENGVVEVAPPKTEWDLVFTSYLHVFDPDTEPFPYQVTGCLINQYEVEVAQTDELSFEEIDLNLATELSYTDSLDAIGYDWKYFDFDLGFVVFDDRVYIIKDTHGHMFKLNFQSFYNDLGEKGNPQFRFQKLQ